MMEYSPSSIVPFKLLDAVCVALMGLASWIVVNGLWYEIPLLVNVLPESWDLPAYLSIFIQIANIGPLLYVPLTKLCRRRFSGRFQLASHCLQPPERLANYVILSVGLLSCILLANFWDVTLPLLGTSTTKHSLVLWILALSAATVDCISTVTFIAYLTGMPKGYVASLSFGEALSDLLPSGLALVQGIGEGVRCVNETVNGTSHLVPVYPPPRFPVAGFLYGLSAILTISLVGFIILDSSKFGLGHYVSRRFHRCLEENLGSDRHCPSDTVQPGPVDLATGFLPISTGTQYSELPKDTVSFREAEPARPTLFQLAVPVLLLCYASMLCFGFLPALQSYSSAAYSQLTFHLSVNLSGVATALLAVLITWLVHRQGRGQLVLDVEEKREELPRSASLSARSVSLSADPPWAVEQNYCRRYWLLLSGFLLLPTAHIVYLASASPNPPDLAGFGPVLAVISWILVRAGFSGLRTWLWLFLTTHCHDSMVIRITGMLSQVGSAIGATLSFLLVVHYQTFAIKPPC